MRTDRSNHYRGFRATVLFMYGKKKYFCLNKISIISSDTNVKLIFYYLDEKVGCGGTVNLTNTQSRQIIRSPDIDHSGIYVPNLDCHWLIVVPPEQIIELTFELLHFDICENATENAKCSCDFLQVSI